MDSIHSVTPSKYRRYGDSAAIGCAGLDRRRGEAKQLTEMATLFHAAANLLEWALRNGYGHAADYAAAAGYSTVAEVVQRQREAAGEAPRRDLHLPGSP